MKNHAKHCIEAGNLESLKLLIENGCSKSFLIRAAVKSQQIEILQYLINQNCDINEFSETLSPALFAAVNMNSPQLVEILLKNGADPTILHREQTVLSYATKYEQLEVFKLLLKYGAPVSTYEPSLPPLIAALKAQNLEAIALLLQNGADPNCYQNAKNNEILRPLDIAIRNKSSSATTLLILTGANLDNIHKNEIEPKTYQQIMKYKEFKMPQNLNENSLLTELKSLIQQYTLIDTPTQRLIERLQESETNPRVEVTPLLNQIRKQFVSISEYIPLVIEFENRVSEKRLPLLKRQMKIFEQTDKKMLSPELADDIRKWREFFPRTMDLLEKNKNKSTQKSLFIDFCIEQMRKHAKELLPTESKILDFGKDDVVCEDPDEECNTNRLILAEHAEVAQQLRFHMSKVDDTLSALSEESILLLDSAISRIKNVEDKLTKLNTSKKLFIRSGLLPEEITEIQESLAPKQQIVDDSLKQLKDNRDSILEMTQILQKLLRRHVK